MKLNVLVCGTIVLTVGGCGPKSLQLPAEPDMSALIAAYQAPTGTIDVNNVNQLTSDLQTRLDELHLDWVPDLLTTTLTRLADRLAASGLPDDPGSKVDTKRPVIDAVINVDRTCVGWADPAGPPDAAANGALTLTAVVEDGRLQPTLRSAATACHAQLQPSNRIVQSVVSSIDGLVDGTINIYSYAPVPRAAADVDVLVSISGQIGTSDKSVSGEFDFRVNGSTVQFRWSRDDGYVLVSVSLSGITLQATNATFQCDVGLVSCTQM